MDKHRTPNIETNYQPLKLALYILALIGLIFLAADTFGTPPPATPIQSLLLQGDANGNGKNFTNVNVSAQTVTLPDGSGPHTHWVVTGEVPYASSGDPYPNTNISLSVFCSQDGPSGQTYNLIHNAGVLVYDSGLNFNEGENVAWTNTAGILYQVYTNGVLYRGVFHINLYTGDVEEDHSTPYQPNSLYSVALTGSPNEVFTLRQISGPANFIKGLSGSVGTNGFFLGMDMSGSYGDLNLEFDGVPRIKAAASGNLFLNYPNGNNALVAIPGRGVLFGNGLGSTAAGVGTNGVFTGNGSGLTNVTAAIWNQTLTVTNFNQVIIYTNASGQHMPPNIIGVNGSTPFTFCDIDMSAGFPVDVFTNNLPIPTNVLVYATQAGNFGSIGWNLIPSNQIADGGDSFDFIPPAPTILKNAWQDELGNYSPCSFFATNSITFGNGNVQFSTAAGVGVNAAIIRRSYNGYLVGARILQNAQAGKVVKVMCLGDSYAGQPFGAPNTVYPWPQRIYDDLVRGEIGLWSYGPSYIQSSYSPPPWDLGNVGEHAAFPDYFNVFSDPDPAAYFNPGQLSGFLGGQSWWGTHGGGQEGYGPFTNVNQLFFSWYQYPGGGNNLILETNGVAMITVNGNSATTNVVCTNLSVETGNYTLAMVTTVTTDTNMVYGATAYNSTNGLAWFYTAAGGTTPQQLLQACPFYTNVFAAISPDIVLYFNVHIPDYNSANCASIINQVYHTVNGSFTNNNAVWCLVGATDGAQPDGAAGGTYLNQCYYNFAASNGLSYVEAHANNNDSTNVLLGDTIHPSAIGQAWGASVIEQQMGMPGAEEPAEAMMSVYVNNMFGNGAGVSNVTAANSISLGKIPAIGYAAAYQNIDLMGWANNEMGRISTCTNAVFQGAIQTGAQGVYNVRPVISNFGLQGLGSSSGILDPIPNSWWVRASLECPKGTYCLMTQNGNTNMLMQGNQVLVPDESFNYIPPYSVAYLHIYYDASNGIVPKTLGTGYITEQTTLNYPQQNEYFDINGNQDYTQGGSTNANFGYAAGPIAVIGQYAQNTNNSVGVMGTSIFAAPLPNQAGVYYHEGMWLLGLTSNTNNPVPMVMGAMAGSYLANWATNDGGLGLVLTKYNRNVILPDCVNDINGGESYSTITNFYYQIIARFSNGRNRLFLPTPTPISTSSDNWESDANQTAVGEAVAAQVTAWIRTAPLGCIPLDVRASCESLSNPGCWRGIGSFQVSWDGIHPTPIVVTNELMLVVSNAIPQFEAP